MTQISTKYSPSDIEAKWYELWLNHGLFRSTPDHREPYTIVIPPPNVTGVLHMGHMLNNTLQDVLIRRARMLGYNACWVPGTDHASIATEAKVAALLKEQGKDKKSIGREAFLEHAFEWKEKYGGIILQQLQKLGCSCDWDRTRFTMEPSLSEAVISAFVKMHNEGLIYKGARMVNWDPAGMTALSDEEVDYEEADTPLYYIRYQVSDTDQHITIATTRPETIMGDTAICVHPEDPRYQSLIGLTCEIPLIHRKVQIIADAYVDMEFGTGALKVTPAHDPNDYELGIKHKLDSIDIMNDDGTLNAASVFYDGVDRFTARKQIVVALEEAGHLIKTEIIRNKIGKSERTKAVIEPKLSTQWFVDMKKFMAKNPQVLDAVIHEEIKLYPSKYVNTYKYWIENIKDWCISRQLWWGHRIPAWYLPDGTYIVAENEKAALEQARSINPEYKSSDLKQDEDVLDTWFSSWLWPISVFDGFGDEGSSDLNYYYPTNLVVTGPDIIFFWIARMIMAGYHFKDNKPFKAVYFTGIVRDKQRRKMSKSLGNSPDPLDLMAQYGTDGVRFGLMLSAPAGNDLLFDESLCEQGRNFCNKIWNAFRLIDQLETRSEPNEFEKVYGETMVNWMRMRISETIEQIDQDFEQFRFSEALMTIYKLIWDDFCAWYLEMIKPNFGDPIYVWLHEQTKEIMADLMKILHPFMPFITEEIWHLIAKSEAEFINQQHWPEKKAYSRSSDYYASAFELIGHIRGLRNQRQISPKIPATVHIQTRNSEPLESMEGIICKLGKISKLYINSAYSGTTSLLGTNEVAVEFEGVSAAIESNPEETRKELERLEKFLNGIESKLSNPKFMANASSEVIDREQQKKEDTLIKIRTLKEELTSQK